MAFLFLIFLLVIAIAFSLEIYYPKFFSKKSLKALFQFSKNYPPPNFFSNQFSGCKSVIDKPDPPLYLATGAIPPGSINYSLFII